MDKIIIKNVKLTKNWYSATTIIAIMQGIFALIMELINTNYSKGYGGIIMVMFLLIGQIAAISCGISIERAFNRYKKDKKKTDIILYFLFSNPFIFPILAILSYGFASFAWMGYTYGFAIIPLIVGHIYYIKVLSSIQEIEENERKIKTEEKQQQLKIEESKNRVILAKQLLEKIGNKFFVENYTLLKNNSIPNIIDILGEKYCYDDLKERVLNAKQVFSKNLQIIALRLIAENKDMIISNELKEKAEFYILSEKM